MTTTQARVLRLLAPGGQLTAGQISREIGISTRRAAQAAAALRDKGFTIGKLGPGGDAWGIAPGGAKFVSTSRGKTAIDVPL